MQALSCLGVGFLGVALLACGSEDPSSSGAAGASGPASGGGTASSVTGIGSGGSGAKGGVGSTTAVGGSTVAGGTSVVSCPAVPARCEAKTVTGDMVVNSSSPATALQGVTEIDGDLSIDVLDGLDALDCLEAVTGNVAFEPLDDGSAPILRNLRTVGGQVEFRNWSTGDISLDCALSSLQSVNGLYSGVSITGGFSGELKLTSVTACQVYELQNTKMTQLVLPSSGTMEFKRLTLTGNESLREVLGFQNVQLSPVSNTEIYLGVSDNPLLSTCRVLELKSLFEAAGTTLSGISGNAPDC